MRAPPLVSLRGAASFQWAKSEISDLLRFIKQPTYGQQSVDEPDWALRAVCLTLMAIILLAPIVYAIHVFHEFWGITKARPAATDAAALLLVVLLGPMIEEVLYRAGLRIPVCSLAVAPVVAMAFLINSEQRALIFAVFLTLIVLLTVSNWRMFFGASQPQLKKLHAQKFRLVFWANCLYFALGHVGNFQLSGMQIGLMWLLTAPQLVYAIVLSYLRLRNGLWSAIIGHATINFVGFTALYTGEVLS